MPQANEELSAKINEWFGNLDTQGPEEYLKSQGYILLRGWVWQTPESPMIQGYEDMPEKDWLCMLWLRDEWDYGMVEEWG